MDLHFIALKVKLKLKCTLWIPFIGYKEVLAKKLWQYNSPTTKKNIFNIHTKEPDKSPPEIKETTTSVVSTLLGFRILFSLMLT